jgi:hypothetical protein
MAMDSALMGNLDATGQAWLAGNMLSGVENEAQMFLGYSYLSELAQRTEYLNISQTIADDCTRKWIDFDVIGDEKQQKEQEGKDPEGFAERMADPDQRKKRIRENGKLDKVKQLKDHQEKLEVKSHFYTQALKDGWFGRMHLFMDIRTDPNQETDPADLKTDIGHGMGALSKSKCPIGGFVGLQSVEPMWTYPLSYNANQPLRKDWYNPQVWYVMGQEIHGSRIPCFIGHPVPDMLKPAYAFGGLALSQLAKPYVDIWLQTRQDVAEMIHSFSIMILGTDMSTIMQPGGAQSLMARIAMFNMIKENQGLMVTNSGTEEFKNVAAPLSGLHELKAQAQENICSATRIPLLKYTGISPSGLNATSEYEVEVYDDTIGAYQQRFMDPHLRTLIRFEHLSLWGEIDPEITHRWNPLRELSPAERGEKEKKDAERDQLYVDMGALAPEEVRRIIIDDPELPYVGLDPDDIPEPPAEQGLLGPGAGGAAGAFEKDAGQEDGGNNFKGE